MSLDEEFPGVPDVDKLIARNKEITEYHQEIIISRITKFILSAIFGFGFIGQFFVKKEGIFYYFMGDYNLGNQLHICGIIIDCFFSIVAIVWIWSKVSQYISR